MRSRLRSFVAPWPLGIGLIAICFAIHLPTLSQPLVETQSFRQTHTAYNALIYHESGIDLLNPQLPVFGKGFVLPEEFPLFQAAAATVMNLGVPPDMAMRLTALVCFLITGFAVWRLTTRVAGDGAGLIALGAFLFSPLGLLVSRMALIEYFVTAASVLFLWWFVLWHDTGKWTWFTACVVAGTVAMLVKPTTAFMYFVPVLALAYYGLTKGDSVVTKRRLYGVATVAIVVVPVVIGGAWFIYADRVRAASPESAFLSSAGGISSYYFGTLSEKLDPTTWWTLIDEVQRILVGSAFWLWVPLALVGAWAGARPIFRLALVISGMLGPLIFTTQYLVPGQEYYMAAVSPLVAVAIGIGGGWVWEERRRLLNAVVLTSLLITWVVTVYLTAGYWGRMYAGTFDPDQVLRASDFIAANSRPDDLVVVAGYDWNPAALYYARREGFMVRGNLSDAALGDLVDEGYVRLFICVAGHEPPCDITDLDQ